MLFGGPPKITYNPPNGSESFLRLGQWIPDRLGKLMANLRRSITPMRSGCFTQERRLLFWASDSLKESRKLLSTWSAYRDGQTNRVTAANTAHGTGTVWFASDRESACGCFQLVYGGAQLGPRQLFRLQLRLEQHRYTDLASHRPKIRSV